MSGCMSAMGVFLLACFFGIVFNVAAGFRSVTAGPSSSQPALPKFDFYLQTMAEEILHRSSRNLEQVPKQVIFSPSARTPFNAPQSSSNLAPQGSQPVSSAARPPEQNSRGKSGETQSSSANGVPSLGAPTVERESAVQHVRDSHRLKKGVLVAIVVASTLSGLIMISILIWWNYRRSLSEDQPVQTCPSRRFSESEPAESILSLGPWMKRLNSFRIARKRGSACALDYSLLQAATNNFSSDNLLGRGGFGCVYKARLDEFFAAVKKLDEEGKHADQDFQTEIDLMSRVRHQNLVSLLGFCINGRQRFLVYELMQNGSLEDQLHGPSRGSALTWHLRMKIALDAARGLEHLHEFCTPPVIHRDFKSANILLDTSFNAKLSDFGLAVSNPGTRDDKHSELQGTFGYVAPEYMLEGILSEKSDVFAFGVVLLELITGRRAIDMTMPTGCESLVTWATPQLTDRSRLPSIVDIAIMDSITLKHLYQVAAVAALCVQTEPSYRPLIADVVHSLIPLVPMELGGALRTEPGIEPEMKSLSFSQHEMKSFSFSQYSSKVTDITEHV